MFRAGVRISHYMRISVGLFDLKIWRNAVFKTNLCVVVCLSLSKGIPLKGNLTGLTDLTHPQLKKHVEAAINISVTELKARFGGLLNDGAEVKTPVQAFRVFNHDTWPDDLGSLLTFGDDDVADS